MKKICVLLLTLCLATNLSGLSRAGYQGHGEAIVGNIYQTRENMDDYYPEDDEDNVKDQYIRDNIGNRVGFWLYGRRARKLISEYRVYIGEGRASCLNGKGYYKDGGWVKIDKWSKAELEWTSEGTNKAYYDYR